MADVKPRRINEKDLERVASHLKEELQKRKQSNYRTKAELIWQEVDRQIVLEAMQRVARQTGETVSDWHSVVELGELSMASELYSADVRRITFPQNRNWFEAHSKIDVPLNPDGTPGNVNPHVQTAVDATLRSLMAQQQLDFGFKARVDLSIKEALHHGSYVVTVEQEEEEQFYEDASIQLKKAPAWVPHSMWNCYPDPSPSIVGEDMYYKGSMFIVTYMPWAKFKEIDGNRPGFWAKQLKKVTKKDNKNKSEDMISDVEIKTYYGDIFITRGDGDIFLPNMKCQLYNDVLCYAKESDTPFKPLIYRGWERLDVRDPYYISPIMKMSPWQKLSTVLANRFVDSIELDIDPPVTYDKNDPDMVASNGPDLTPGAKIATSNPNTVKELQIGNPQAALEGLQFCVQHLKQELAVTPQKAGQALGDRATAREVASVEAGAEVRPVDFISKLEESLRCFLYMQHALNLRNSKLSYEFYNAEMGLPDFMRVVHKDLPKQAHFEVVGARGLLGEKERAQTLIGLAPLVEKVPAFAGQIDHREYLRQIFMDAGVKNPEALMVQGDNIPPQVKMMVQQMQQQMQEMAAALKEAESGNYVKLFKSMKDNYTKMQKILSDREVKMTKIAADHHADIHDRQAELFKTGAEIGSKITISRNKDGSYEGSNGKKRVKVRKTADGNWEGDSQTVQ